MEAISLKDRVKYVLRESGMTAAEFAEAIQTNRTSLFKYFNGSQPTLYEIVNIPTALENVSAEWLFTGEGSPHKTNVPQVGRLAKSRAEYTDIIKEELSEFLKEPINLKLVEPNYLPEDADLKHIIIEQQKTINLLLVKIGECRGQLQLYKEFVKQVNSERASKQPQTATQKK